MSLPGAFELARAHPGVDRQGRAGVGVGAGKVFSNWWASVRSSYEGLRVLDLKPKPGPGFDLREHVNIFLLGNNIVFACNFPLGNWPASALGKAGALLSFRGPSGASQLLIA